MASRTVLGKVFEGVREDKQLPVTSSGPNEGRKMITTRICGMNTCSNNQ